VQEAPPKYQTFLPEMPPKYQTFLPEVPPKSPEVSQVSRRIGCATSVADALEGSFAYYLLFDVYGYVRLIGRDGAALSYMSKTLDEPSRTTYRGLGVGSYKGASFLVVLVRAGDKALGLGIARTGVLYAGIGGDLETICPLIVPGSLSRVSTV
jgi:hypothetical protein